MQLIKFRYNTKDIISDFYTKKGYIYRSDLANYGFWFDDIYFEFHHEI